MPPRYRDIADQLRSDIAVGLVGPGDKLGTDAELRARFGGVSTTTIRAATRILEAEGAVRVVMGSGIFVVNAGTHPARGWPSLDDQILDAETACPDGPVRVRGVSVTAWWTMSVGCAHGMWIGQSDDHTDPGRAAERALQGLRKAHEKQADGT